MRCYGSRDRAQPPRLLPAAVEADESVAWAEREAWPVADLLERIPRGEEACRLPHFERPLGCRPLVRAGADELESALRHRDGRLPPLEGGGDRCGDVVEAGKLRAEDDGQLGQPGQRAEMAGSEGRGGLLDDGLNVGAGYANPPDGHGDHAVSARSLEH